MNIAQVDSAISKASRLMNEDYMAYLDGINAMTNGGKKSGGRRKGGNDLAYLDQQVFGRSSSKSNSCSKEFKSIKISRFKFTLNFSALKCLSAKIL